jgi:hypothetical protein
VSLDPVAYFTSIRLIDVCIAQTELDITHCEHGDIKVETKVSQALLDCVVATNKGNIPQIGYTFVACWVKLECTNISLFSKVTALFWLSQLF